MICVAAIIVHGTNNIFYLIEEFTLNYHQVQTLGQGAALHSHGTPTKTARLKQKQQDGHQHYLFPHSHRDNVRAFFSDVSMDSLASTVVRNGNITMMLHSNETFSKKTKKTWLT